MIVTYIRGDYKESFDTVDIPGEIAEVTIDVTNPNATTWGFKVEYDCPVIPVTHCKKKKKRKK